jgi:hypothetical protein
MKQEPAQILDQQLDLLDRQACPEQWPREHERAMICRDIEDMIALALETLDRIKRRCGSLPDDVLLAYFRRWYAIGLRALDCIERVEGEGFKPERADAFRFALNEASIAEHIDEVAAAQKRLESGQGRTLDEIMDADASQA